MSQTRRLIIATSRYLLTLDLKTGKQKIISEKYGLYYGISWDASYYYVAARWYPWFMPTSHIERPRLLVFDSNFHQQEVLTFPVAAGGLHQILCQDHRIYCSCSREDSFAIRTLDGWQPWYPSSDINDHNHDMHHFNSIWTESDRMYIVGHNRGPSDVWELSYPDRELVARHRVGRLAHNVWREGGELAVCNSGEGRLETVGGHVLCETGKFPRGIIIAPDINVVGISAISLRSNRLHSRGSIQVYSKNWELKQQIDLGPCGQVCEIRSLDSLDLAHNNLPPPK